MCSEISEIGTLVHITGAEAEPGRASGLKTRGSCARTLSSLRFGTITSSMCFRSPSNRRTDTHPDKVAPIRFSAFKR